MAAVNFGLPQSFTFQDVRNFKAVTRMFAAATSSAANANGDMKKIATALVGLTTSATVLDETGAITVIKSNGVYTTPTQAVTPATTGAYQSISDKVAFVFADAANRPHKFLIACPLESIFSTDNIQVDRTNAAAALFVSQVLSVDTWGGTHTTTAACATAQGPALVGVLAAYRVKSVVPRRFNTSILNSDETGGAYP